MHQAGCVPFQSTPGTVYSSSMMWVWVIGWKSPTLIAASALAFHVRHCLIEYRVKKSPLIHASSGEAMRLSSSRNPGPD